jgi:dTDP-4-amino-4,6-dideoxygalactose transaminase
MAALQGVATSGNYSEGPFSKRLEGQLEAYVGDPAKVVNSCGSALYIVMKWLRRRDYRDVLVQNNTFFASGAMVRENDMQVHLVDNRVDCPSMSVDSLRVAHELTGARVVLLTHVGGWVAKDYQQIAEYCQENRLFLVEDCAHALGVPMVGSLGQAACWSFYPTKAVPCGEGGAVTSRNEELLRYVERYRQYGKHKIEGTIYYDHGMNLRMSEWDAAVMSVQMESMEEIVTLRRQDAEKLQSIAPCLLDFEADSNFYKFPVSYEVAKSLKRVGAVYTRSDQLDRSLVQYGYTQPVTLANSYEWASTHVCLPVGEGLFDGMTETEVARALSNEV